MSFTTSRQNDSTNNDSVQQKGGIGPALLLSFLSTDEKLGRQNPPTIPTTNVNLEIRYFIAHFDQALQESSQ